MTTLPPASVTMTMRYAKKREKEKYLETNAKGFAKIKTLTTPSWPTDVCD